MKELSTNELLSINGGGNLAEDVGYVVGKYTAKYTKFKTKYRVLMPYL